VLEEKTVRPVGSREVHPVDVRIVAATNKDLKAASERGEFREDLYYRLNVIEVTMPSLRERGRDIDLLAEHFVARYAARFRKRITGMDRSFREFLHAHDWPGNVRELENLIERAVLLADQESLTRSDLDGGRQARAPEAAAAGGDEGHPLSVENYIRQTVLKYQDQYSEIELASLLGIGRKALWTRRRRWGLPRQGRPGKEADEG